MAESAADAISMIAHLQAGGFEYRFDLTAGRGIGLTLDAHAPQPAFFGAPAMRAEPLVLDGFTGRVSAGASCNVDVITLIPHCNGTHTEGPGHILDQPMPVQQCVPHGPLLARLISVDPQTASTEHYPVPLAPDEPLITADSLTVDCPALIVRTRPNDLRKRSRDYTAEPLYPLLSSQAMQRIVAAGTRHLLIDTPSVDRADDGGRLANHRIFWGIGASADDIPMQRRHCTITELIYVPDDLEDGLYLLDLRVSPIVGDASPSAPVLYPMLKPAT